MINFFRKKRVTPKYRKLFAILSLCVLLVVIFVPQQASAACISLFNFSLADCVGEVYNALFEFIILPVMGIILGIIGLVLDAVIKLNLNSAVLNSIAGINVGWKIVRDLINMSFIFILIYVAISTILQEGSYQAKTYLPKVVIAILLINFSLFFTKVIIDAGNIVAHGFYSAITSRGTRSLSEDFIKRTDVVRTYDPTRATGSVAPQATAGQRPEDNLSGTSKYLISIARALLIGVAIYVFCSVVLVFVGRIIGLTFVLMLSPIGFVGNVIPGAKGASNWWWKQLWDQTLVAPVFMVLYYLAVTVIDGFASIVGSSVIPGGDLDPTFYLNYIIAIGLLVFVVRKTKELGGEFGSLAQKIGAAVAAAVGTVALGVATGGAAAAGRVALGRVASGVVSGQGALGGKIHSIAGGEGLLGKTAIGRWAAKRTITGTDRVSKAGFDIRENKGFQKLADKAGLGKKSPLSMFGAEGIVTTSFNKRQEDRVKKEQKFGDIVAKKAKDEKDTRETVVEARNKMITETASVRNKPLEDEKKTTTTQLGEAKAMVESLTKQRAQAMKDKDDAAKAITTATSQTQHDEAQQKMAAAETKIQNTDREMSEAENKVTNFGKAIERINNEIKKNTETVTQEIEKNFVQSFKKATTDLEALVKEGAVVQNQIDVDKKQIEADEEISKNQVGDTQIKREAEARIQQSNERIQKSKEWLDKNKEQLKDGEKELEDYKDVQEYLNKKGVTESNYDDLTKTTLRTAEGQKESVIKSFEEKSRTDSFWRNRFRDTEGNRKIAEKIRKSAGKKADDDEDDDEVGMSKDFEKMFKKWHKKKYGEDFKEPDEDDEGEGKKKDKKDKKEGGDKK